MGQEVIFQKGKTGRSEGNRDHIPNDLGWRAASLFGKFDKTSGSVCHMWGEGVNKQKVDRGQFPPGNALLRSDEKKQ